MSTTDLFGKPLGVNSFKLSKWQKRQAALLYYFASREYLEQLIVLVKALRDSVDQNLTTAQIQGRDQFLQSDRWGVRDTAANYSTHGFPGMEDFLQSLLEDLTLRDIERYRETGCNDFFRRINELSQRWMTLEEEKNFNLMKEKIQWHACGIDENIIDRGDTLANFHSLWQKYSSQFIRIPKFIVRTDLIAHTGQVPPPRTGVYVPQDDPYGALQFTWRGCAPSWDKYGALADMQTFNDFGLAALKALGPDVMWSKSPKVMEFVTQPPYIQEYLRDAKEWQIDHPLTDLEWPPAYLSGAVFTTKPTNWYFVEIVEGEFENEEEAQADFESDEQALIEVLAYHRPPPRTAKGAPCPKTGWWSTSLLWQGKVRGDLQYIRQGEPMPAEEWHGSTWTWDHAGLSPEEQQTHDAVRAAHPAILSNTPCPFDAVWAQRNQPLNQIQVLKDQPMPQVGGQDVYWQWVRDLNHHELARLRPSSSPTPVVSSDEVCPLSGVWSYSYGSSSRQESFRRGEVLPRREGQVVQWTWIAAQGERI